MDNIENCADCGKKFSFTERIFHKTNGFWICEDCAITQMQEDDKKDQKIADLEAKLADRKQFCESQVKSLTDIIADLIETKHDLEAKLAEKEKECQDNLHHAEFWQSSYKRCIDRENQAKLDFAIEKLKEVKKLFEEKYSYDVEESDFAVIYETDVDEIIDQQISNLKGDE